MKGIASACVASPIAVFATLSCVALCSSATAAENDEDLANKGLNPVASLISVPIRVDYDRDIGPREVGNKYQMTIQPVIPFSISTDWNLISRTLIPLVSQESVAPGVRTQSGLGDSTQPFYFSPKAPAAGGLIWGMGPPVLLRTSGDGLSAKKWGLGPTAVALRQKHGRAYGALVNHLWSVVGDDQARTVSSSYLQPFLSFTTKRLTTYGINIESTYH